MQEEPMVFSPQEARAAATRATENNLGLIQFHPVPHPTRPNMMALEMTSTITHKTQLYVRGL